MGEKGDNDKKDAIEQKEENKPKVSYSSLVRLEIILGCLTSGLKLFHSQKYLENQGILIHRLWIKIPSRVRFDQQLNPINILSYRKFRLFK